MGWYWHWQQTPYKELGLLNRRRPRTAGRVEAATVWASCLDCNNLWMLQYLILYFFTWFHLITSASIEQVEWQRVPPQIHFPNESEGQWPDKMHYISSIKHITLNLLINDIWFRGVQYMSFQISKTEIASIYNSLVSLRGRLADGC